MEEGVAVNNRDTLLAALSRRVPDRIPYTYDARPEADERFRSYLGLQPDQSVADHFNCNRFSSLWSVLGAGARFPGRHAPREEWGPDVEVDLWGCGWQWIDATPRESAGEVHGRH